VGDATDQRTACPPDERAPVRRPGEDGRPTASTAPVTAANPAPEAEQDDEMPRVTLTRRRTIAFAVFVLVAIGVLYFVLPQISGVKEAAEHVSEGDRVWLAVALAFEVASIWSYIALFHGIHVPPGSPLTHRDSALITMAGIAATRLLAAAGAGGVALTAWALRRSGMERREVAERMIAFLVLLYGVYLAAMLICGVGLREGVFPGKAPFAVTLLPAIISAGIIAFVLGLAFVPDDMEERMAQMALRRPRLAKLLRPLALGPTSIRGGVRFAIYKACHPDLAMIGAVTWWAFNIGVLWACFHAFGTPPPLAVLVQAFFVGMLGNLLPLPGGIGGVDGGMIGALAAFGVDAGLAVLAVLAYRLLAFWLPTVPGVLAYFRLRRRVQDWQGRLSPA
jgi:uncharacterized protein (TIRG00374 family)